MVVESQPEQELAATSEPEPQPEPIEEPQPEPVDISSLSTRQLCQLVLSQVTTPDMNAYQKVTAVNNYLCSRMEYDLNYHTTRDAILLGKGRCQGYANAFKSIMTEAGIPTDYVRGYAGGNGTHAWNRVLIDGAYYCVDVTWNDSTGANTWLLMPEAEFNVGKSIIAYNPPGTE